MNAHPILTPLRAVNALRDAQATDKRHQGWVRWVKDFQSRRFALVYADLLAGGAYRDGALFFINELYGPQDMRERDAQFERVVPALERLFPERIQHTVAQLTELHALSESLDDQVARAAAAFKPGPSQGDLESARYVAAWQATGRPDARAWQIDLVLNLVRALEHHTRSRLLRSALRAMRVPARAAGLAALQHFLEAGFDTFGRMGDTLPFQTLIETRERALAAALFSAEARDWSGAPPPPLPTLAGLPMDAMPRCGTEGPVLSGQRPPGVTQAARHHWSG